MPKINIAKVSLGEKNFLVKEVYPYKEAIADIKDEGDQAHIILRDRFPLMIVVCGKKYYLITPAGYNRNTADLLGLPNAPQKFNFQVEDEELRLTSIH